MEQSIIDCLDPFQDNEMQPTWSEEIDCILSVGRSLSQSGVKNWALACEDALVALNQLATLGVAVLGGDVYHEQDGTLELSYDNWYCDSVLGENEEDFVVRSIERARSYIKNYGGALDRAFFALVPKC